MRVHKYHGAGNDFVLLADLDGRIGPLEPELVVSLCERNTGVGADGVVRIVGAAADDEAREAGAAYRFDLYNADGLPAEVSGNGVRCVVAFERDSGRIGDGEVRILTGGGPVVAVLDGSRISVDMGEVRTQRPEVPMRGRGSALRAEVEVAGTTVVGSGVNVGNPHFAIFVSDLGRGLDDELVRELGPAIETHPDFPERVNVEFVEVVEPVRLRVRTWERGVGETMACGSGACAAAFASAALQRSGEHVIVEEPGGELEIEVDAGGHVWLTGPAEGVFAADIDGAWLAARGLDRFVSALAGKL